MAADLMQLPAPALIVSTYSKAGQWHKSVQVFEQMQHQHCKTWTARVYQNIIDSLWRSGVCWAQWRAWQLSAVAARNWQYRFTVQQGQLQQPAGAGACGPCLPALALVSWPRRKWLGELVAQAEGNVATGGASWGPHAQLWPQQDT